MSCSKIEFAVHMTCDSCVDRVKKVLNGVEGIKTFQIDLKKNSVVVDTLLPTVQVQQLLETSGRKVIVRGLAGSSAAVVVLDSGIGNVQGVIRLVQVATDSCLVDGTIDGLLPGKHNLSVHECGDISKGCKSIGPVYNPSTGLNRPSGKYGDLGSVVTIEDNGRAKFRFQDSVLKLSDVIGRSLLVSDEKGNMLACGIIARSAGLFENPKTICACDGVSIWDEVPKPKSTL